jgi:hypothetical protein
VASEKPHSRKKRSMFRMAARYKFRVWPRKAEYKTNSVNGSTGHVTVECVTWVIYERRQLFIAYTPDWNMLGFIINWKIPFPIFKGVSQSLDFLHQV